MNEKESKFICDKISEILSKYDNKFLNVIDVNEKVETIKIILKSKVIELLKSFDIDYDNLDVDDYFNIYVEIDDDKKINVIIKQKPLIRKIEGIWKIV